MQNQWQMKSVKPRDAHLQNQGKATPRLIAQEEKEDDKKIDFFRRNSNKLLVNRKTTQN